MYQEIKWTIRKSTYLVDALQSHIVGSSIRVFSDEVRVKARKNAVEGLEVARRDEW